MEFITNNKILIDQLKGGEMSPKGRYVENVWKNGLLLLPVAKGSQYLAGDGLTSKVKVKRRKCE